MCDECSIVVTSQRSDITSNHPGQLFQSRGLLICQLYITEIIIFRLDMRNKIINKQACVLHRAAQRNILFIQCGHKTIHQQCDSSVTHCSLCEAEMNENIKVP